MLDTSAYSAALVNHSGVQEALREAVEVCISPVVLGELHAGFLKGTRTGENRGRLKQFLQSPRVRIAAITEHTAERYALIRDSLRRAGTPVPANDLWIAAGAMEHALRVVTLDDHFRRMPQIVVDYFGPDVE